MFFKAFVFCTMCKNIKIVRKLMQGYLRTENLENIKILRLSIEKYKDY